MGHDIRVVVVTGAGSGIGRAVAEAFGRTGAVTVVACRGEESGQQTVGRIERDGGRALFVRTDVSNESSVRALFATVAERFGRLDVLVNNAGISFKKPFYEVEEAEWDRVIDINLKGVFLCSKHAVKLMQKNGGGSIVNISSIDSLRSLPKISAYGAAKGGVNSLTQTMALDVAQYNIRVNAVLPGFIQTAIWDQWIATLPESDRSRVMDEVLKALAIKRIGTPDDVANAVLFLASDKAGYITGTTLVVDGGLTARAYVVSTD